MKLFLLTHTLEADVQITYYDSKSLSETLWIFFGLAGSAQQAQQSAHLAEGLNLL